MCHTTAAQADRHRRKEQMTTQPITQRELERLEIQLDIATPSNDFISRDTARKLVSRIKVLQQRIWEIAAVANKGDES